MLKFTYAVEVKGRMMYSQRSKKALCQNPFAKMLNPLFYVDAHELHKLAGVKATADAWS